MRMWLDDIRTMPSDYDVHVRNPEDAIAILKLGLVTHIGLDHDLADRMTGEPYALTGKHVARFIEEEAYYGRIPPMTWSIQSDNPDGIKEMRAAMINADKYWSRNNDIY